MLAYEELRGSSGREVWFRPPRYEARKLFPHVLPRVRVGSHLYNLQNISLGGVAVLAQHGAEANLEPGEIVPLTIQQSGLSIFESEARVCRTETTVFGAKVAFNFLNNHVEFDTLLNRNAQAQIARRSSLLSGETAQLVSKDYRAFCSDVLNVLRSYRAVLDENSNLASQFGRTFDADSAYEACAEPLLKHWRTLWRTGNDLAREIEHKREAFEATKEFTEIVLTPELVFVCMVVLIIRRAAFKPARYAVPAKYGKGHAADAIFLLALIATLMLADSVFDISPLRHS